jgi:aminopeptidase N
MHAVEPSVLAQPLAHSLSHAWFGSSHVWLDEGVAQFMSLLWVEQSEGREAALKQLQQQVNTLSLAEPALPQNADSTLVGQSLIQASDEVYYRTKAAAVLWMLRSIAGEDALKQALQLYRQDEKADVDAKQFQRVLERASKRDLGWFFDDWVYRDRGLPDLTIASVTPRKLPSKGVGDESWLVAIEVRNDGDAAAEVPVTVRSGTLTTTEKLRIMGRSTASTRIVFAGRPDEVVVNDGGVPEVTAPTHSRQIEVQ